MSVNVALLAWAKAVADGNVVIQEVRRDSKGRFVKKDTQIHNGTFYAVRSTPITAAS